MSQDNISDELQYLRKRARRRLVGAIALVVFALTVLWTVLDSKPPQFAQKQTIEIISSAPALLNERASVVAVVQINNGTEYKTPPVDAAPEPVVQTTTQPIVTSAVVLPGSLVNHQVTITAKPTLAPTKKPVSVATSKPKAIDPLKILEGGEASNQSAKFYVQIGAFGDQARVAQLVAKLKKSGLPVTTEKVTTSHGVLTRIKVGPSQSESQANEWRKKSESIGISGKVVRS